MEGCKINGLDLFSGIGGLTLALAPWVRPVAYCEIDRYCQGVLLSRMASGDVPVAPIWDDVTSLRRSLLPDGPIDIIYGGFPCQDISIAGTGAGLEGERSQLFFEVARLVRELRPSYVFLENVAAISLRGLDRVTAEFSALGYDCRWDMLRAYDVGAPHLRERWWCLAADTSRIELRDEQGRLGGTNREGASFAGLDGASQPLADSDRSRLEEWQRQQSDDGAQQSPPFGAGWWTTEPNVGRVVARLPHRVDRLRALGNSVVPQCAREAFIRLSGLKREGEG